MENIFGNIGPHTKAATIALKAVPADKRDWHVLGQNEDDSWDDLSQKYKKVVIGSPRSGAVLAMDPTGPFQKLTLVHEGGTIWTVFAIDTSGRIFVATVEQRRPFIVLTKNNFEDGSWEQKVRGNESLVWNSAQGYNANLASNFELEEEVGEFEQTRTFNLGTMTASIGEFAGKPFQHMAVQVPWLLLERIENPHNEEYRFRPGSVKENLGEKEREQIGKVVFNDLLGTWMNTPEPGTIIGPALLLTKLRPSILLPDEHR